MKSVSLELKSKPRYVPELPAYQGGYRHRQCAAGLARFKDRTHLLSGPTAENQVLLEIAVFYTWKWTKTSLAISSALCVRFPTPLVPPCVTNSTLDSSLQRLKYTIKLILPENFPKMFAWSLQWLISLSREPECHG